MTPVKFLELIRTQSLGRSIVLLLGVAFLALLATNITTFLMIQRIRSDNEWVGHTFEVRRSVQQLFNAGLDAEGAGRGYLITHDESFLATHRDAVARTDRLIAVIARETADNRGQQARIARLRPLFQKRYAALQSVIDAERRRDTAAVRAQMLAGRGAAYSGQIRALLAEIDTEESKLLVRRRGQSERAVILTTIANALGGALILAAAAVSVLLFRRALREVEESRAEVEALNAGLEQTVRDRTDDLVRANGEIQRFAYIVSHDLRAPLVNVMGYTSELQAAGVALERQIATVEERSPALADAEAVRAIREDVPEAIGFIRASTAKMDGLINAILRLSREGRRNLTVEPVDMNEALNAMADAVNHQVQAAGAKIKIGALPSIESDRVGIEQVFGNLIDNAVKYLQPGRPGSIAIWGRDLANGYVEYAVADNGRGIAERDHERVFELFRRAGVQDRPGEGLGLAFVKNTVLRLGGLIWVESEPGKGSTFRVKLPKRLIVGSGAAE